MTKLPKAPRPMTYKGHTVDVTEFSLGEEYLDVVVYIGENTYILDEDEYTKARYQALHPPLCMKHALEIGYEFEQGQRYIIKRKLNAVSQFAIFELRWGKPYFETKHDVFKEAEGVQWFYPVNEYDQPNHGEAESYVKPWEAKA